MVDRAAGTVVDTVKIETLGAQGDGVTADGVFVSRTLPGEEVRINPTGHRAIPLELLRTAPDRVVPVCGHFGNCGGCSLQHASDGLLAGWKQDLIRRALSARGIEGMELRPMITSPPKSRRRAVLAGKRTKKGTLIGFHAVGSDEIIPINECAVIEPAIMAALPVIGELVLAGASRKAVLRVTVTTSEAGLDIAVTGGKDVEGPMYGQLVAIAATSDIARLSWEGEPVVTRRPPTQRMGKALVLPPPGGFLQATAQAQAALTEAVGDAVDEAKRITDLFAGSGTFTLPLAENAEVHAVEADKASVEALDQAWRTTEGLRRVTVEARELYHRPLLPREFKDVHAVVFDPPRAGARAQCEHLAQTDVPRIAAVSCNPATFARDARILIDGGYQLQWVQPIDQFLWTPHVELAAAFSKG